MTIKYYDDIKGPVGLYDVTDKESRDPEAILREGEFIGNLGNKMNCSQFGLKPQYLNFNDIKDIRSFFKKAVNEYSTSLFIYNEVIRPWTKEAEKHGITVSPNITSDGLFVTLDEYFKWQSVHRGDET